MVACFGRFCAPTGVGGHLLKPCTENGRFDTGGFGAASESTCLIAKSGFMTLERPISRSIEIESLPSAISELCQQVLSELERCNFSNEDVFAVHLALEEALLNAFKHGNKMDATRHIKLDYTVDAEKVEIYVADEGEGFNPDSVPDPRCGTNIYKPEGRGLLLMRSYMDIVEYNEKGNCVHMIRYREKPPVLPRDQ